jgi:hypothetical protein
MSSGATGSVPESATSVTSSHNDASINTPFMPPGTTETGAIPNCYIRVVFENLEPDERELTTGSIALSEVYDIPTRTVRLGGFDTVSEYLLHLASRELQAIIPLEFLPPEQFAAFQSYGSHVRFNWLAIGQPPMAMPARNAHTRLTIFLGKIDYEEGLEVTLLVRHPDSNVGIIRAAFAPPTPAATIPAIPRLHGHAPSPLMATGSSAPNLLGLDDNTDPLGQDPPPPKSGVDNASQGNSPSINDGDSTTAQDDAGQRDNDAGDAPGAADNGTDGNGTPNDNGAVNEPDPLPGEPTPPAHALRFSNVDMSGISADRSVHAPRYHNTPSSTDSSFLRRDLPPDDMIGKVTPNYYNAISPDQSAQAGAPVARSYSIFVPRSTPDLPMYYSSFEFVPEQRTYLLYASFRAGDVGKMKLPAFVAEDTAMNWHEAIATYGMGRGIYIPPYGTFEYGNPMGKMWPLVEQVVPHARDTVASWSNSIFTLLSEAANATPSLISCVKPNKQEVQSILLCNTGNGYKALYEIMQYHATHLNLGSSSRIRNDGPPKYGKCKSVEEYLARYKEYWVQRYYYSSTRTVCLAPELQLSFLDRLPHDIKNAFNAYCWRAEYDDERSEHWYYNTLPTALHFDRISDYITMACDRQSVNITALLSRARSTTGTVSATRGGDVDEDDGSSDDDDMIPMLHATQGAPLPLCTCAFCPDYQGRHELKSCSFLARVYAASKRLQSDADLRGHMDRLYPGDLKRLPPRPPPQNRDRRQGPGSSPTATARHDSSRRPKTPQSRSSSKPKPRAAISQTHGEDTSHHDGDDDGSVGSASSQAERRIDQTYCLAGEVDELPYEEAFGLFACLTDDDSGCVRALSNSPFPRFSIEDAVDRLDDREFPIMELEDCSHDDVGDMLFPVESDSSFAGSVSMTAVTNTRRKSTPPWQVSTRRHLYAHMDHGANLSVVYDRTLLHRFVEKPGLVIRDVGNNRHPTLGYGLLCLHAISHSEPIYIPAYFCPSLASNIISPQQVARYFHASQSSTVLDTSQRIGSMYIYSPRDTTDIVVSGVLYDSLLWAGPLIVPPRDGSAASVLQPWASVRVNSSDPAPVIPGSGEADDMYVVEMALTRAAAKRKSAPAVPPVPSDHSSENARHTEAKARAEYEAAMARITALLSGETQPVSTPVTTATVPGEAATVPGEASPNPSPPSPTPLCPTIAPSPSPLDSHTVTHARLPTEHSQVRRRFLQTLLHQRLGHLHQRRLRDLPRFVDGVPKTPEHAPTMCTCPICIASKMRRSPAGTTSTRTATSLYQGLSIDLGFVVQRPPEMYPERW